MAKIKIGFIGAGWRAHGYMRVIREPSDQMEVSGVFVRRSGRAAEMELEYPGKIYMDLEAFMNAGHDFVFVLVPREYALSYLEKLAQKKIPVLVETPPANGVEELKLCYELKEKYDAKIQVAEQYFLQPYHCAVLKLIEEGRFGEISNMEIAMIHDYHGLSIMRKALGITYEPCTVTAKGYKFPVLGHCDRGGLHVGGTGMVNDNRKRAEYVFDNGKVGFFDFADEQYFNYFRTRHIRIQGTKGEICDLDTTWMGEDGWPVQGKILRDTLGEYSNLEGCKLRGLNLNGERIYENPFKGDVRLNDDEIAMAGLLVGMKNYVDTGVEIYPLEEGLQDTYLYLMMDESIATGKPVRVEKQQWAK